MFFSLPGIVIRIFIFLFETFSWLEFICITSMHFFFISWCQNSYLYLDLKSCLHWINHCNIICFPLLISNLKLWLKTEKKRQQLHWQEFSAFGQSLFLFLARSYRSSSPVRSFYQITQISISSCNRQNVAGGFIFKKW